MVLRQRCICRCTVLLVSATAAEGTDTPYNSCTRYPNTSMVGEGGGGGAYYQVTLPNHVTLSPRTLKGYPTYPVNTIQSLQNETDHPLRRKPSEDGGNDHGHVGPRRGGRRPCAALAGRSLPNPHPKGDNIHITFYLVEVILVEVIVDTQSNEALVSDHGKIMRVLLLSEEKSFLFYAGDKVQVVR